GTACGGVWMFNSINWQKPSRRPFSKETTRLLPISTLPYHEKTLGLRRSWDASTMCLCPSPHWWSRSCSGLSTEGGPSKAPHHSFGFRKKLPVLRYADNRSNNNLACCTGKRTDRMLPYAVLSFPQSFFVGGFHENA